MATESNFDLESSTLLTVADDPLCKEASLPSLDSWITPTDRYYIRNHFSHVPALDLSSWRLEIDGLVDQPLTLAFDDVARLPGRELAFTMECAGNSRSYVTPPAEGLAFRHGAVSTARWKGVSLRAVLEMAGVQETATSVVFEGADRGEEEEDGVAFDLSYRRSLPLAKALDDDTLLAFEMNGEPITTNHGFPMRLIVPSWYGMASVKWLTRIHLTDQVPRRIFPATAIRDDQRGAGRLVGAGAGDDGAGQVPDRKSPARRSDPGPLIYNSGVRLVRGRTGR